MSVSDSGGEPPPVPCAVYRCPTRDYTYLFVDPSLDWADLPPALARLFEGAEKILDLELGPDRPLAQADVIEVIAQLHDPGYHLQLPPEDDPSGWLDLPSKRG